MPKRILLMIYDAPNYLEHFKKIAPDAEFLCPSAEIRPGYSETVTRELVESADIILGNPSPDLLRGCTHLELLQTQSAGVEAYLDAVPEGTILANATGAYGLAIAEHMLAQLLFIYKDLDRFRTMQKEGRWRTSADAPHRVRTVYGSTVLCLGLGDIGGRFASLVGAMGATTIGVRRKDTRKPEYLNELYLTDALDSLLPRADVLAMSLPNTPETRHIMDARRLSLLKPGAVLLNVGRGNAVDTDALCDALESGHLAAAGLDVTDPEPLPQGHRLWTTKNAYITPHISGGDSSPETVRRVVEICSDNLRAYLAGEPLKNVVDRQTGYRTLR